MAFLATSARQAKISDWWGIALLVFAVFSAVLIGYLGLHFLGLTDNHLTLLADQFRHLNLSYGINHPKGDVIDYFANFYSYFGPVSSVVLIPFVVLFGASFPQIAVGIMALLGSFIVVHQLAGQLGYSLFDRLWWAIFFCFSTVMVGVSIINISAYQVQSLAVLFALLSLREFVGKKRYVWIGFWLACAGASRLTYFPMVIFFILAWWQQKRRSAKELVWLLVPIVIAGALIGLYNFRRFGSLLESGYRYNITLQYYPMHANYIYGFLSPAHIPANLYNMLLRGPDPIFQPGGGFVLQFPYLKIDPWGLSIFISSPLLLLLFKLKPFKGMWIYIISIGLLAIPMLLYFGVGYSQFGYRYFLDVWPLVLVLLMKGLKPQLGTVAKALITVGVIFNMVFMMSLWGLYPHFWAEINPEGKVVFGSTWLKALSGKYR